MHIKQIFVRVRPGKAARVAEKLFRNPLRLVQGSHTGCQPGVSSRNPVPSLPTTQMLE